LLTWELVRSFGFLGCFFALVIAFPLYLFLLSVLPKSLCRRFPFHALARLAGVLEFLAILLWPIFEVGARLGRLFLPRRAAKHARLLAARDERKQITAKRDRAGPLRAAVRA